MPADAVVRVGTLQLAPAVAGPLALALRLRLPSGEEVDNAYESVAAPAGPATRGGAAAP